MEFKFKNQLLRYGRAIIIALILICVAALQINGQAAQNRPSPDEIERIWKSAEKLLPAAAPATDIDAKSLKITLDPDLIEWKTLEPGLEILELGLARGPDNSLGLAVVVTPPDMIILRIDPELFEFTLHMASEDGSHRTLAEHARLHGLSAAINAGMYLPDNLTNTGFMQSSTHINNPRIVARFGVFFVAEPNMDSLPKAMMLEKSQLGEKPSKFLAHYQIGVQNFRLMSANGEVLWPDSQTVHSISALAQDEDGKILFTLCRFQLSPADFSRLLLALPLNCTSAMYLEGGSQAGLLLKMPSGEPAVWRGKRNSILALDGPTDATLPNVLGIRPRLHEPEPQPDSDPE